MPETLERFVPVNKTFKEAFTSATRSIIMDRYINNKDKISNPSNKKSSSINNQEKN